MGVDLTQLPAAFNTHERTAARKMQMVFGWDNTPRILTGGIHGHVYIEALSGPVIDRLAWATESVDIARRRARVRFLVELDLRGRPAAGLQGLRLRIEGRSNAHGVAHGFTHLHPVTGTCCECRFEIEDARLWWPNGMGEPHLYATTVTLCDGKVPLDCRELLAGLRTVALDTSSQGEIDVDYDLPSRHAEVMDGGLLGAWQRMTKPPRKVETRHFRLLVNGVAVFARGANWQTADVFPAAVTDARRRALLAAAAGAHMNMIRLWGGGAPEPGSFYDEAARRGLMIWQDFFFACAKYPEAGPFLAELREELDDVVRRLRNHTAIVLWCGDNESDMIDANRGGDPGANPINKRLIPDALRKGDPQGRPYHPSSPSGGPYPRSDWAGDRRDWGAWYPENNYIHIRQDEARFMSEGGCYALPSPATFEKYFAPENRWPPDCEILRLHTGDLDLSVRRFDRLNVQAWEQIAPTPGYREAIEVSQFAQAWGCKTLIEHHRMRRAQCGGLLLWKLNDAWPAIDAGLLDYDLRPRLALAFVGEAMKPVALATGQDMAQPERLRVALVNDTLVAVKGVVTADYLLPGPTGDYAAVRDFTATCDYAAACAQAPARTLVWTSARMPAWTSATVDVPANSMIELPALQQPDPQGVWVLKFTDEQGGLRQSTAATRSARTAYTWWRQQGASGVF
jgi:beta-mannosidase